MSVVGEEVGEVRLVGGAPINMAAGEGVAEAVRVVSRGWWMERGVRPPRFVSRLCDLELFPPPQEKAPDHLLPRPVPRATRGEGGS